jgi:hypothetical protein
METHDQEHQEAVEVQHPSTPPPNLEAPDDGHDSSPSTDNIKLETADHEQHTEDRAEDTEARDQVSRAINAEQVPASRAENTEAQDQGSQLVQATEEVSPVSTQPGGNFEDVKAFLFDIQLGLSGEDENLLWSYTDVREHARRVMFATPKNIQLVFIASTLWVKLLVFEVDEGMGTGDLPLQLLSPELIASISCNWVGPQSEKEVGDSDTRSITRLDCIPVSAVRIAESVLAHRHRIYRSAREVLQPFPGTASSMLGALGILRPQHQEAQRP